MVEAGLGNVAQAGLLDEESHDARIVLEAFKRLEPFVAAEHSRFTLTEDRCGGFSSEAARIVSDPVTGPEVAKIEPSIGNSLDTRAYQAAAQGAKVEPRTGN